MFYIMHILLHLMIVFFDNQNVCHNMRVATETAQVAITRVFKLWGVVTT